MKKAIKITAAVLAIGGVIFTGAMLLRQKDEGFEKVSVSEAREELKDYKFGSYENLEFKSKVRCTEPETVYEELVANMVPGHISQDELKADSVALLTELLDGGSVDESKLVYWPQGTTPDYVYEHDDAIFDYYEGGSLLWVDLRDIDPFIEEADYISIHKKLIPEEVSDSDVYNVGGEDWALSDAIEFADKKLSKLSGYLHIEKPRLAHIEIGFIPSQNRYIYKLRYYHMISGLSKDDSGGPNPDREYLCGSYIQIEMDKKDKLLLLENYANREFTEKKEAKKIIPLSEAERLASEYLASGAMFYVNECELRYVTITHSEDTEQIYRPMWVFAIEDRQYDYYGFRNDDFQRKSLYIDAVTGEYFIYQYGSEEIIREGESWEVLQ